jgi:hypothetical protein
MIRRLFVAFFAIAVTGCSGGSGSTAPGPTPSPAAFIAFVPNDISLRSSQFDYFGFLTYSARAGLVPRPISPPDGSLACDQGIRVRLQIHQGPAPIGVVHDEYLVLPLSAKPKLGTTLTCSSTWGLFDKNGTMVAQAQPLQAKITYDTGKRGIYFSPSVLILKSSGGLATSTLAYATANGFKGKALAPLTGFLTCKGGYTLTPQLRAGPLLPGYLQTYYEIDPSAVEPKPKKGQTLGCASVWGLVDPAGNVAETAALVVAITYDTAP